MERKNNKNRNENGELCDCCVWESQKYFVLYTLPTTSKVSRIPDDCK